MDNGEDWQKPNTFGEAALRSLEGVLDQLRSRDWRGLLLTGKPFVFAVGADIGEFGEITPERARLGGQAGTSSSAGSATFRSSPSRRSTAPRSAAASRSRCTATTGRSRPRYATSPAPRSSSGSSRAGADAARPAARRRRAGRDVHRREPAPPEPHARRAARVRRRLRRRAPRAGRVPRRVARLPPREGRGGRGQAPAGADLSDVAEVCRKARSRLDGQVHGATPAPYRALDLIEGSATWSLEEGYRAEEDALAELLPGPEAQASVYAFNLVERRAKRGVGMPDAEPRRVQKVGVVGAGLMARQLALLFLRRLEVRSSCATSPRSRSTRRSRGSRTSSPTSCTAAASPRARRASSARSSPAAPAGTSSPAATSCSRRSSRRWP